MMLGNYNQQFLGNGKPRRDRNECANKQIIVFIRREKEEAKIVEYVLSKRQKL